MTLDLRQLRHLLAIVEHGTFGRAAAALNMTEPALSRSVKVLEQQVGAELWVRSAAGATPTDEGLLLIRAARHLLIFPRARDSPALAPSPSPAGAGEGSLVTKAAVSRFRSLR